MLLRNKITKTTAIAIAAMTVFGSGFQMVNALEGVNQNTELTQKLSEQKLQNGEYKVNNIVKKENVKPYRGFFAEETKLVAKDSKYYLTFTNTNVESTSDIKVKINGSEVSSTKETIDANTYKFTIEVTDLESQIVMNAPVKMGEMVMPLEFEVGLNMDTLEVITLETPQEPETPTQPEVPKEPETPKEPEKPAQSESDSTTYKNGYYKLKNTITDHSMPSMIRYLLLEDTNLEIVDGKISAIFNIPDYDYVGEIEVTVDGKIVSHKQNNSKTDKSAQLIFEVPSVDSTIKMKIYSPITKKDSVFGIKLEKSTIEFVDENKEPNQPNNNNNNTDSNNSSSDTNNSNTTTNVTVENVAAKGKRYTIKNEISADSPVTKKMGRNYTKEISKIEEVDGKKYAVLTFTGLNMMNKHRIYVDGSLISHQVVGKTSDSVTLRFLIPSEDANIKVKVYVVPMNFDSEFNVKLLKDTLTFEGDFDTTSTLPQTGSLLNNSAMMMAGTLISSAGIFANRKKK